MQGSLFLAKVFRKLKLIQNGSLRGLNFKLKKGVNNVTFSIPVIRNTGWNNIFDNEPWMGQLLEKLLKERKGIFIDVGANIGQTLLKVKSISSEINYYGFEANPVCLFYLNELVSVNNFTAANIIPVGLSDRTGLEFLNFYSKNTDDATASIIDKLRPDAKIEKRESVYLTTLDSLSETFSDKISVIKIDVEGAENEVLNGAIETIIKHKPFIIIEILPSYTNQNIWRVERHKEIEQFVKTIDYKILNIRKSKNGDLESLMQIELIGVTTDILERDYLLIPSSVDFNI